MPTVIKPNLTLRLTVLNSSLVLVENLVYLSYAEVSWELCEHGDSYLTHGDTYHDKSEEETNAHHNSISHSHRQDC